MLKHHSSRMLASRNKLHDMKNNRCSSKQIQTYTRISKNSILSVLQPVMVISKLILKHHKNRMLACHNKIHDMKKNRCSSKQIPTFTRISENNILSVLQPILVISKLWAKAHRGRLLAGHSKFQDMKKNRSSTRIQTFTRINNNSILSVLLPVMVLSKLLGKPQDRIWMACRSNLHDIKNNRTYSTQVETFTRISNNSILMRTQLVGIKLIENPHNSSFHAWSQRM